MVPPFGEYFVHLKQIQGKCAGWQGTHLRNQLLLGNEEI